ncbi:unnamed protein product [Vitrella brassicaformis CCMP3155]|uniref:4Fe-4S ferredoxin-type domain-containing protein n=1 Tax=Vitrella brassicaformis (strain CCMP3155) TaxID=1169540 RepID=A0A0G4GR76_VITBC|nr:unnamed protein product [Vitrella brassicaformis CCMP3155]|eukprot:CEM33032.1 unnamed protein product [Vitrella brassicaformis CCMP3155]
MTLMWCACFFVAVVLTSAALGQEVSGGTALRGRLSGQQTNDVHQGDDAPLRRLQCCSGCTTPSCFANCNPGCAHDDTPVRRLQCCSSCSSPSCWANCNPGCVEAPDDAPLRRLPPCCSSCTSSGCWASCNPGCAN